MTQPILFSFFGHASIAQMAQQMGSFAVGQYQIRNFPDGETYLRIQSNVVGRSIVIIAGLNFPNDKLLTLLFAAETLRDLGAKDIGLVAPYLAYMRQDKQFNTGEGITSKYFAALLSKYFNWLVTIDPHLHRWHSLNDIYQIPTLILHAENEIAKWIAQNITHPLLIGPDQESEQWVLRIAQKLNSPFIILNKVRKGDQLVEVSIPEIKRYKDHTPILIDDIISTAKTMIAAVKHLNELHAQPPICIGVHAIFAGNAYEELINAGAKQVVTCNTIEHSSNAIDLSLAIIEGFRTFLAN